MEIFATRERQEVLDMFGIDYCVDQDLNFVFPNKATEEKAIRTLENACEL